MVFLKNKNFFSKTFISDNLKVGKYNWHKSLNNKIIF
jgi:hypothetical protein